MKISLSAISCRPAASKHMRSYFAEDYEKLSSTEKMSPCLGRAGLSCPTVRLFPYKIDELPRELETAFL